MAKYESLGPKKKFKMQRERCFERKLPVEMLTEIFKYLTIKDRKVIKQVCKRWNDACNIKQITDSEKFFFSGIYPTDKILGILSKSRNNYFNLEFQKANFMFPYTFWDKCGSKVANITLVNCRMSKESMEKLVVNCTNLLSLTWKHDTESKSPFLDSDQFQTLMEKNIVRPKLRYMEISVTDCWISAQLLRNIFSVFPSIVKFTIYVTWTQLTPLITQLEELLTQNAEIFHKLDLKFSGYYSPVFLETSNVTSVLNTVKITELPPFQYDSLNSVSNLKCVSKNLESFQCFATNSEAGTFANFVLALLGGSPKLRLLEMYSDNERDILNREFVEQLLNSSLDTLSLRYLPPLFEHDVFVGTALPVNRTIKSLCIRCALDDPDTSSLIMFLSALINLEHLSLNYVSNAVLKHVWESHTNLKSLSLCVGNFWKRDEFFGSTDGELSTEVHIFKNLQYLKLESVDIWPLEGIMNSIDVPNLRFLELKNLSYISFEESIIYNLGARLPALECLTLSHVEASYDQWCSCINGFKQLRFLRLEHKENNLFSKTDCEQLFKMCPSLRILCQSDSKRTESYYYDILQKKVVQKYLLGEYQLTSEKLSTLCGHWAGPDGLKFIEADLQFIDNDSDYENDSFLYSDSDYEFSFSEEDELMLAVMGDWYDEDRHLFFHDDELIDENDDWL